MPLNADDILTALTDFGLLTRDELTEAAASFPGGRWPEQPGQLLEGLIRAGRLTKFQATTVYSGNAKTLLLGDYVLLDRLGAGGMGQVYKARHRRMKRDVALKVLPPAVQKDPALLARFQREVETAARLTHPHVVTAYDAGESRGVHYLVIEYVPGFDLSAYVRKHGPVSPLQAVNVLRQAATGLDYAHRQGVIHRDIKPGNFLISREGVVKVADLGLARVLVPNSVPDAPHDLTDTGAVMGTVDYMAPEQAVDTHQADARSDVYSLGCTLAFLLSGRPPFPTGTVVQRILAHRDQPPKSLTTLLSSDRNPAAANLAVAASSNVHRALGALDAVYQKMLAKRPEDRYQSMAELLVALHSLQGLLGTDAPGGPISPLPVSGIPAAVASKTSETFIVNDPNAATINPTRALPTIVVDDSAQVFSRWQAKQLRPRRVTGRLAALIVGIMCLAVGFVIWLTVSRDAASDLGPTDATPSSQRSASVAASSKTPTPNAAVRAPVFDPALIPADERLDGQPKELVAVLGSHARRSSGQINGLVYSDDGRYLISADAGSWLIAWEAETLCRVASCRIKNPISPAEQPAPGIATLLADPIRKAFWISVNGGSVYRMAFRDSAWFEEQWLPASGMCLALSPDGRYLVIGGTRQELWNLQPDSPQLVAEWPDCESDALGTILFSPDQSRLLSRDRNGNARMWDLTALRDGPPPAGWRPPELACQLPKDSSRSTFMMDEERQTLLVQAAGGLQLYDVSHFDTPRVVNSFPGQMIVKYSQDGHWFAGSTHGNLVLYDRRRSDVAASQLQLADSHQVIACSAFSPNGQRLAAGDNWGRLRQWDLTVFPPKELAPFPVGSGPIDIKFSPDGDRLISCGEDIGTRLWRWQAERWTPQPPVITRSPKSRCACWSADGQWWGFLGGSGADESLLVLPRDGSVPEKLPVPSTDGDWATAATLAPSGRKAAVATANGAIHLWERTDENSFWKIRHTLSTSLRAYTLQYAPDSYQLAAIGIYPPASPQSSAGPSVLLWDLRASPPDWRSRFGKKWIHSSDGQCLDWFPNGTRLCVPELQSCKIWDLTRDQPRQRFELDGISNVNALAISPDGQLVAIANNLEHVAICQAEPFYPVYRYRLPCHVRDVEWHPSGAYLATANSNGTIYMLAVPDSVR